MFRPGLSRPGVRTEYKLVLALAAAALAAATPSQAEPGVLHVSGEVQLTTFSSTEAVQHTIRHANGTWGGFGTLPTRNTKRLLVSTPQGGVTASTVDIAQVGSELHAVVLGSDAQLYHSIRRSNGAWDTFDNVGPEAGDPGTPAPVSVTASRGALQVAIATSEGGLFHTIRFADGFWQAFGNVKQEAGSVPSTDVTIAGD